MIYDKQKVQEAARQTRAAEVELDGVSVQLAARASSGVQGQLEGLFAEALQSELQDLSSDMQKLETGVSKVQGSLNSLVASIEMLDKFSKELINRFV